MKKVETKNIMDKVKTIEDVITIANPSEEVKSLINYSGTDKHMLGAKNAALLFLVAEVLNEGWEPDWNNTNERKWVPYFKMNQGVGFSFSDYGTWASTASVGSRLCFKSEELSEYSANNFTSIYAELLTK